MVIDDRLGAIEQHHAELERRLRRVELQLRGDVAPQATADRSEPTGSAPNRSTGPFGSARSAATGTAPAPAWLRLIGAGGRRDLDWEQVLGGRVLAWAGAVTVLSGLVLLFALGVSQGWIGEAERTLAGGAVAAALVAAGAWLHERRGRTEAARAAVAAGVAGLFLAVAVAAREYVLIPPVAALVLALGIGALGTWLAVRWHAQVVAAVGLVGAMLAPALAGAPVDGASLPFLLGATGAAAAVAVRHGWAWLGGAVALVATPQWLTFALDPTAPLPGILAALCVFGLLHATVAAGYELRMHAAALRRTSAFLLALNAVVLGAAGWLAVQDAAGGTAATAWLGGLALAHAVAGGALRRVAAGRGEASAAGGVAGPGDAGAGIAAGAGAAADAGLLALGLAVVLADAGFALAVDGPARAIGWAAGALAFAALARRLPGTRREGALAGLGLGGHVALSALQAVAELEPGELAGPGAGAGAIAALGALAASCLVSARLAEAGHRGLRVALDATGLLTVACLAALTLGGPWLTIALAAEAVVLWRLAGSLRDGLARRAALGHLAAAAVWALADQASPVGLVDGSVPIGPALLGCGAIALASLCCHLTARAGDPARPWLAGAGALALLHGASLAAVGLAPAHDAMLLEVGALQQGQLQLSTLWALAGVGALVAGLARNLRTVRLAGLGLLGLTTAKVFLHDLAALTSGYRIASFLALGVLLLAAAYAYQRLRPEPPADLRDVPGPLRS